MSGPQQGRRCIRTFSCNCLHNTLSNLFGGARLVPEFQGRKHFLAPRRALDQVQEQIYHNLRRRIALLQQTRGPGFLKSPGVEILVIVNRRGIGDEDGRQAHGSQFGE